MLLLNMNGFNLVLRLPFKKVNYSTRNTQCQREQAQSKEEFLLATSLDLTCLDLIFCTM